jgi:hypothetical protein
MIAVEIVGAAAVIALLVWAAARGRYGEAEAPEPGWRWTGEVFIDPTTRRQMRVWLEPDGTRHYVAETTHGPARRK